MLKNGVVTNVSGKAKSCVVKMMGHVHIEVSTLTRCIRSAAASICLLLSYSAHSGENIDAMKSAYIYYFSKFVVWQDGSSAGGDLTVCAMDPSPSVSAQLGKISGKKFGSGKIQIELMRGDKGYSLENCKVLFVSQGSQPAPALVEKIRSHKSLLVINDQGVDSVPAAIQFVLTGSRLGFTIDTAEAAQQGLVMSSKLLQLATDGGT